MSTSKNPRRSSIYDDNDQESAAYISEGDMFELYDEYYESSGLRTSSVRPKDIFSTAWSVAAWNKKWEVTESKKISHEPNGGQADSVLPKLTEDNLRVLNHQNNKKILADIKARKSQRTRITLETIRQKISKKLSDS